MIVKFLSPSYNNKKNGKNSNRQSNLIASTYYFGHVNYINSIQFV